MNIIVLIGRLCKEPELKSTNSGKSVVTADLAVNRPFSKDTTDFIPVVLWEKNAEFVGRYAHKGSRVAVSGKLTTRKYQDKDGNNRVAYEVVADSVELMDSKSDGVGQNLPSEARSNPVGNSQGAYIPEAYSTGSAVGAGFVPMGNDDDLPF